jgi:vacuolar-type H+-ATPase subunit E/Vma4
MEEIVGTDAIRGEILEDARKKAARILEEAELESARDLSAAEAKAASVVEEILESNEAKSARYRMETMARFPLERTRMLTAFVDARLREAMGSYIGGLPEDRVSGLAEAMLSEGSAFFEGKAVEVLRKGLSEEASAAAASRAFASSSSVSLAEDASLPGRGFVARGRDGSALLRATMDLVGDRLLDRERGELARALCAEALSIGPRPLETDGAGKRAV